MYTLIVTTIDMVIQIYFFDGFCIFTHFFTHNKRNNGGIKMDFTLEELNVLSEKLEKERAEIYNQPYQESEETNVHHLEVIAYLQQRLSDREQELYPEEKQYIASLITDELEHIHGNAVHVYQSILDKLR